MRRVEHDGQMSLPLQLSSPKAGSRSDSTHQEVVAATGTICPGAIGGVADGRQLCWRLPMVKKAALQIITKGCFHMEWDTAGKVFPSIKAGQVGFEILSRDLVK